MYTFSPETVSNPQRMGPHMIDCDMVHPRWGVIRFTASDLDDVEYGRQIYAYFEAQGI